MFLSIIKTTLVIFALTSSFLAAADWTQPSVALHGMANGNFVLGIEDFPPEL